MQGTLFDIEPISSSKSAISSRKVGVVWSFSKRNVLETCPRKYFYQYYASKLEKRGSPKDLNSVRFLKMLSNKHLVLGKVTHDLIRLHFTHGKPLDTLIWMAKENIKKSIDYTLNYQPSNEKKYTYVPQLLQEVFLGDENYRVAYQEVEEKICIALKNFFEDDAFRELLANGQQPDAMIEKKFKLNLGEEIRVSGVLDLAYRANDQFIIVDWKTGKIDDGDDSMQLITYTWWALENQGISLDKVKLCKAYLLDNEVKDFKLSERDVFMNKMAIRQSSEIMLEMAEFGESGDYHSFTPCKQSNICSNCSFQKICN